LRIELEFSTLFMFKLTLALSFCYLKRDEGVLDMSLGEIAKIHCSPDYAYGANGFPAWGIMPNSELIFEIQVLSIN